MEIFKLDKTKYIVKCTECFNIIKFKINFDNFKVNVECRNGHNKDNIGFQEFINFYIRNSSYISIYCYNCFNSINDSNNNFICKDCNKLFCKKCINRHMDINRHKIIIDFIPQYKLCQTHNEKYSFYCEICKINICDKCKFSHENHNIKFFQDIIPNIEKLKLAKQDIKNFECKLDNIFSSISKYKIRNSQRYEEVKIFFKFLNDINDKLINNFNDNYYDYYNFENLNYLLNLLKNENILNTSKYIDYILPNNEKDNIQVIKKFKVIKNNKEINYIKIFYNLKYLKDNLFYIYDYDNYIKIYEFKNFTLSFNSVLLYNLEKLKIKNINIGKYNNIILLNSYSKKNIKILEYDINNKSINLSKKEVKEKKSDSSKTFEMCIDNKNGNIIATDSVSITVWRKNEKKYFFEKYLHINEKSRYLFNINDNLFGIRNINNNLKFYETESYKCLGKINYNKLVNYVGNISNILIGFSNINLKILFFVNLKYFEIVQIISNDQIIYAKNNYLYSFYYKEQNLKILKKKFDVKRNDFISFEDIGPSKKIENYI